MIRRDYVPLVRTYRAPTTVDDRRASRMITGIVDSDSQPRQIYPIEGAGFNGRRDEYVIWDCPMDIESDWTERTISRQYQEQVCRAPDPFPEADEPAYEYFQWVEEAKPYWIRAKDIRRLQKGQIVDFACFHRNACDLVNDDMNAQTHSGQLYTPQEYFHNIRWRYWHEDKLHGVAHEEGLEAEVFQFEYFHDDMQMWYPLREDESEEEIPDDAFVGWRGPAVFWDDLSSLPKVYRLEGGLVNLLDRDMPIPAVLYEQLNRAVGVMTTRQS